MDLDGLVAARSEMGIHSIEAPNQITNMGLQGTRKLKMREKITRTGYVAVNRLIREVVFQWLLLRQANHIRNFQFSIQM